jgi:crotonobetainyl-CoA:carnitine CoA-transferase CaiB-like acyl-CoA transferase
MAPHGVYPAQGDDRWIALACRDDDTWGRLVGAIGEPWAEDAAFATLAGRLAQQDELDERIGKWTSSRAAAATVRELLEAGVAASVVKSPAERIDEDDELAAWGLFPVVDHPAIGSVRVEGLPLHLSETDWSVSDPAPCLGEDNDEVYRDVLGLDDREIDALRKEGVI